MIIKSINNNLKHEILSYSKIYEIQATTKTLPQPLNSHNQIPEFSNTHFIILMKINHCKYKHKENLIRQRIFWTKTKYFG